MTDSGALERLAALAGIEPAYVDIWGTRHETTDATNRTLLKVMGIAAGTDDEAAASLQAIEAEAWHRPLPPVVVVRVGESPIVPMTLPAETGAVDAEIV